MSSHRKCIFTKRPILPKERDGVQLFLAELDSNGRLTGKTNMVDICGSIRRTGEIDSLLLEKEC
ncbi:rps21 [Ecytonucleospora hepatopenaei]|uniref:Rps21 n=1 Tax=Ecytonucleospora hepatopenaei TaxID=646526 RepID=A0A1W0E6C0_9MICR|nr:rps21 [Ecytonucleospora hepatopenaei]